MKPIIIILLLYFPMVFFAQQNISFEKINSQNILHLYSERKIIDNSVNTVVQIGNYNDVKVYDKNPKELTIVQQGDYNTTLYINAGNNPTKASVSTRGDNNYIDITGSNSISEKMKININNSNMTIFVRNY